MMDVNPGLASCRSIPDCGVFAMSFEMLSPELRCALDLDRRKRQRPPTAVQKIDRSRLVKAIDNQRRH